MLVGRVEGPLELETKGELACFALYGDHDVAFQDRVDVGAFSSEGRNEDGGG
jgi:hypothetical protein